MSIFKNILKSIYKFDEYSDFLKLRIPYIIVYLIIFSTIFSCLYSFPLVKRYCLDAGGAKGVIDKLVPEFAIKDNGGINVSEIIIKSLLDEKKDYSFFDYIIDTSAENPVLTKTYFKEKYNYPAEYIQPPMAYVTSEKTYLFMPNSLNLGLSASYTQILNSELLSSMKITSKEDCFKFAALINIFFAIMIFSVFISTFMAMAFKILYFSVLIFIIFRFIKKADLKFSDVFKISIFAVTPAFLYEISVNIINIIISFIDTEFYIFVPPFMTSLIFAIYIIIAYKKGGIFKNDTKA